MIAVRDVHVGTEHVVVPDPDQAARVDHGVAVEVVAVTYPDAGRPGIPVGRRRPQPAALAECVEIPDLYLRAAAHPTAALHACAAGLYHLEAGGALLAGNGTFLRRDDFTSRFITTGTSISDGTTLMAAIDWDAATTALHAGELPCSGGERRVLKLSSSLAGGIPVDLRDAVTGLDDGNIARLVTAIFHAAGKRPENSGY